MNEREAFALFLSRIELNPSRVKLASERYNTIKGLIESKLPGKTVYQIGSFQRRTKIKPSDLSDKLDVDMLVSFGKATHFSSSGEGVTPKQALRKVYSALISDKTYKVMEPKEDSPTVTLQYSDNFSVELVPAFIDKMGKHNHNVDEPDCFIVGHPDGSWVPADYDYDAYVISNLNQGELFNKQLVPLIKMFKFYCRANSIEISSFYLELLTVYCMHPVLKRWSTAGYTWGYNHMFSALLEEASKVLGTPYALPDSYTPAISLREYSTSEINNVKAFLSSQSKLGWRICDLSKEGFKEQAVFSWSEFFGSPFPSG